MNKPWPVRKGIIVVAASFSLVACGGDPPSGLQNSDGSIATVSVRDNFFDANVVTVNVGESVRWVWEGDAPHNITFDVGGNASVTQTSGDYEQTFMSEGTFRYHCTVHGAAVMAGLVTAGSTNGGTGIY